MIANDDVLIEFSGFVLRRGDGSFHRVPYDPPLLPPSPSGEPVSTRDVPLNPTHGTLARIYLPRAPYNTNTDSHNDSHNDDDDDPTSAATESDRNPRPPLLHDASDTTPAADGGESEQGTRKLPILLYFHGGGFLTGSTMNPPDHGFYCKLALRAQALIVSVDYRLAPEHPLPAAYHDCFEALQWLNEQARLAASSGPASDPWLARHGDFSRCFLGGDSAGANLVHHVTMRAVLGLGFEEEVEEEEERLELGLGLRGLIYIHPFFTCREGEGPLGSELERKIWELSGARDGGRFQNPVAGGGLGLLERAELPPSLVAVAGKDKLRERGEWYHKGLCDAGKVSKLFLSPGEEHVFHLFSAGSHNFGLFMDELSAFLLSN